MLFRSLAAVISRRNGRPLVVTSHGGDLNLTEKLPVLRFLAFRVGRSADAVLGVSRALCNKFEAMGIDREKVYFAPLGVDVEDRQSNRGLPVKPVQHEGGLLVLYVGSLSARKSVLTLLKALSLVQDRGTKVRAVIAGNGPERKTLARVAASLGLLGVEFLGECPPDQVQRRLAEADVLVMPSLSEGRPVAIMEAMANNLPVVASDIPGNNELVTHRVTGLLFPVGDSTRLAEAIQMLAKDPLLRQRLGAAGHDRLISDGLTGSEVVKAHREVYERVTRRKADNQI